MKDVIIALDLKDRKAAIDFLDRFSDVKPFVKIGMELFYAEGPSIIKEIKERGHQIFLDLKLHDIPNTVAGAMRNLSGLGVDIINVHAAGGLAMMKAAVEGSLEKSVKRPLIIAVTQLTSTSEQALRKELLIDKTMEETVLHYARNAKDAGLDGIVCSPLEVVSVKKELGDGFLTITPGIRFEGKDAGDQVRITTPKQAGKTGTDFIVVGRPITQADDPQEAYKQCLQDFMEG
ncbi:MAG: orotidine-5'-phosphate decarboxylase [Clostridia bacterium]|nr:orotidine-5'-phosphate decarboxylase [Clostridia bacterium]